MIGVHEEDERGQHVGSVAAAELAVVGVLPVVVVAYHIGVASGLSQAMCL